MTARIARVVEAVKKMSGALAVMVLVVLPVAWGCSGQDPVGAGSEGVSTSKTTSTPEVTLGEEPENPEVTLRIEGDRRTTFSGICTVGGKETVISGRVPKQFDYDLRGEDISCRIQKQDSRTGSLRVILLTGDTTRSVQQANSPNSIINVSYSGK